jgi:hypothetical protein
LFARALQNGHAKKCKPGRTTDLPGLRHVVGIGRWCCQSTCLRRPRPRGTDRKQKRATLASTHWKGCWGHLFSTAKARFAQTRSQKSRHTAANFGFVELIPRTEHWGRGEDLSPSPSVRQPSDCCPTKRHVWGTRQSRWFRGPAALLCVRAARRLLRPARIRILTTHAPICSRIYLPASSRRQRELGVTNLGLDRRRGLFVF